MAIGIRQVFLTLYLFLYTSYLQKSTDRTCVILVKWFITSSDVRRHC